MTGPDDDRELDDFLARRSVHHRRLAERDRIEPSPELDRLVLDKAREAIDVPANAPVYRSPRWALPVALAATLVLAFAVVLNMSRLPNRGIPLATATPGADVSSSAELGDKAAPSLEESFAAEREAAAPFAPEPAALARSSERQESTSGAESDSPLIASTGGVAAQTRESALRDQAAARASDVTLAKAHAAAPPAAPGAAASPAVVMPREVAAASDHGNLTASTTPASPPLVANTGARAYAPPAQTRAIVPAKSEMTVSNAPPENAEARRFRKKDDAAGASADTSALENVTVTTGTVAVRDSAAPLSAEAKRANPQAWLREIAALRAQGKTEEAEREFAEFRKLFPAEAARFQARDPRPAQ
jgi:hypothetical protein